MNTRHLSHNTPLAVSAGEQRFEQPTDHQVTVSLLLAQIHPTTVVLSALLEPATENGRRRRPAIFNMSIVAEQGISLTEVSAGLTRRSLLTARQVDVLAGVCDGLSQKEIGAALDISVGAVEIHLERIRQHLHARTTVQAVFFASDLKLIGRRAIRSPFLDQTRVTSVLVEVPTVRISLTPLEQIIELGDNEKRTIVVGTRGRVHVSQIRRPPTTRNRQIPRQLLRPPRGKIPPEIVAAQMGLIPPEHDVHASAREWLAREIYAADSRDADSPIFTTFDT